MHSFIGLFTGYPEPEITWYKDDEEMDRYCGLPKYEVLRNGKRHTLQIYKCVLKQNVISDYYTLYLWYT